MHGIWTGLSTVQPIHSMGLVQGMDYMWCSTRSVLVTGSEASLFWAAPEPVCKASPAGCHM